MATLYVDNVPDTLYEALRKQARQHRKSIAAEIVALLEENVVTAAEQQARHDFLKQVRRLRSRRSTSAGGFSTTEELQRDDRSR